MILDIWNSFRSLPAWVKIWVALILVPVNAASIFFVGQPYGVVIAMLAIGGMLPNIYIIARERGFSKAMAFPHIVIWIPLVIILIRWMMNGGPPDDTFAFYIKLLLIVDIISLAFDIGDVRDWIKGNRSVAGKT